MSQKFIAQAGTSLSVCQITVLSCQCLLPLRRLSVLIMMALGREPLWPTQDWEAGSLLHMPTVTHGDCEGINLQLLWPHVQVLQPRAKAPITTTKVKGNEGEHYQDHRVHISFPQKNTFLLSKWAHRLLLENHSLYTQAHLVKLTVPGAEKGFTLVTNPEQDHSISSIPKGTSWEFLSNTPSTIFHTITKNFL